MGDGIGDRMKTNYEKPFNFKLPRRMPVILRLDGKAFHTFTRGMVKPFDKALVRNMQNLALYLCHEIQGAELAYVQSDEISILLHNYKTLESQAWFDNKIQKIVSVSAGIASSYFSRLYDREVIFDARVFVIPESEVNNYFIWRQQDWERNSIQMLARSLYPHKELYKKNREALQEMCFQKEHNWNDLPTTLKRGTCINKKSVDLTDMTAFYIDKEIPIFTQDRNYVEQCLIDRVIK